MRAPLCLLLIACGSSRPTAVTVPSASAVNPSPDPILDLIKGTSSYTFYDPETFAGVIPPPQIAMIRRATKTYFFGWGAKQAYEDARGRGWLLTSSFDNATTTNVMLFEISSTLESHDYAVVALPAVDPFDRRVAVTADGSVVVAWIERSDRALVVVASWLDGRGFHDAYIGSARRA